MAGRSCSSGSVVIYLLICLMVLHFSRKLQMLSEDGDLQLLEAGRYATKPRVNFSSSRQIKPRSTMAASLNFVLTTRLINVTLAANLILLANDISLNRGPAYSTKGLRIYHLNIHSLRNKLDELRLFYNEHKPHVLSTESKELLAYHQSLPFDANH